MAKNWPALAVKLLKNNIGILVLNQPDRYLAQNAQMMCMYTSVTALLLIGSCLGWAQGLYVSSDISIYHLSFLVFLWKEK